MAYGDNRQSVYTDDFTSYNNQAAFDAAWDNGPGNLVTFDMNGGPNTVQVSDNANNCACVYSGSTLAADMYCTVTIEAFDASGEGGPIGRAFGGTDEQGYFLNLLGSDGGIIGGLIDAAGDTSDLGVDTALAGQPVVTGDTLTIEVEGSTIRLGANTGSGDTLNQTITDETTYADAGYGGIFGTASTVPEYSDFDMGDISAGGAATNPGWYSSRGGWW